MSARKIGYVRSDAKGNIDSPAFPVELDKLFVEKISKKSIARPKLKACTAFVQRGDQLIVWSMNDLADNPLELIRTIKNFTDIGVSVRCYQEGRIFSTGENPIAMLTSIIATGFPVRPSRIEKKTSSNAEVKKTAEKKKKALTAEQISELKRRAYAGENKTVLARDFSISKDALHKYLKDSN